MDEQSSRAKKEHPSSWTPFLYDYVEGMPEEGWVWEFMRRAKMLSHFKKKGLPVEAMKYHGCKGGKYPTLYWTWSQIIKNLPKHFKNFPSVRSLLASPVSPDLSPFQFIFGLELYSTKIFRPGIKAVKGETVVIEVDLDRRDTVIKRDFQKLFAELRKKFPEPKMVFFNLSAWRRGHVLEVWDLRQYEVPWKSIKEILKMKNIQQARNSLTMAKEYIDDGGWKDLHRSLDWIK